MNALALKVNRAAKPDFKNNDTFSALNMTIIILGGSLMILAVVGIFLPEVPNA